MRHFLIFLFLLLLISCKQGREEYSSSENYSTEDFSHGKQLMETYCYACHSPDASMEKRLAPPMAAIKMHYIDENTSEEEFLEAMISWVKQPSEANSKMPGAIRNFGLMPFAPYPEDDVKKIGQYLYHHEVDTPEGFQEHMRQEHGNGKGMGQQKRMRKGMGWQDAQKSFKERGLDIAMSTQGVLAKNLLGTVQKKGVPAAIAFCNERAYPITDSMSTVHQATIKRISDRFRNPDNKASEKETALIAIYQELLNQKQNIEPIVDTTDSKVQFYYPIVTNDLCLKCHGNPKSNIDSEVMSMITSLYPEDHAIGYDVNQVRGLWSIQMDKE